MFSDIVTISNQKIGEGTFSIVSIGHIKTLDSFCAVKGENILVISMPCLSKYVAKFSEL